MGDTSMGYDIVVAEAPLNVVDNGVLTGLGEMPLDDTCGTNPSDDGGNLNLKSL